MHDRQHLETLLAALDASPRALRRDQCGDWAITGKSGHILADGEGYLLCVSTDVGPPDDGPTSRAGSACAASPRTVTTKAVSTLTGCQRARRPVRDPGSSRH